MNERLVKLYKDMSELTSPECAKNCRIPHSCCSPEYCDMAKENATEEGIVLHTTSHPTLMYMGPNGCIVEPHLRPLCTFHTCSVNNYGYKPGDELWTETYFALRNQIEKLSWQETELRAKMADKAKKAAEYLDTIESRIIDHWEDQFKEKD